MRGGVFLRIRGIHHRDGISVWMGDCVIRVRTVEFILLDLWRMVGD